MALAPRLLRHGGMRHLALLVGLATALGPALAQAHARLIFPPPRNLRDDLKTGPCGGVAKTNAPYVLRAGDTIKFDWEETIDHVGHYEIWFSDADANCTGANGRCGVKISDNLADAVKPAGMNRAYSAMLPLPAEPCLNLSLIHI